MKEARDRDPIESTYSSVIARGVILASGTTSDPKEAGISAVCSGNHGSGRGNVVILERTPYRDATPPKSLLRNIDLHLQHYAYHARKIQVSVIQLAK